MWNSYNITARVENFERKKSRVKFGFSAKVKVNLKVTGFEVVD
jgi:hypothetical protein